MDRDHGVYKYVYNGEVIYVGKTNAKNGFKKRIACHEKENELFNQSDIYIYECKNKAETDSLETVLINAYKPMLNKNQVYDYKLEPPKLNWVPWQDYLDREKTVLFEQALIDLKMSNITRTLTGKPVTVCCWFPSVSDNSELALFGGDNGIRVSSNCDFPTKDLLLKMKDEIDNMLENYDCYKNEFRQCQIKILKDGLEEEGYILKI